MQNGRGSQRASISPTSVALFSESALITEALKAKLGECQDIDLVRTETHADRALDAVRASPVDVVILESTHHIEQKIETVRSLSSRCSGTKVLVLCVEPTSWHVAFRLVRAGAHGFLPANVGSDEVVEAIRTVAHDRFYLPPELEKKFAERHILGYQRLPEELLTDREFEVMRKLALGQTNREIAAQLFISPKTVDTHRASILRKLELRNNSDITRFAIGIGVVAE